MQRHDVSGTTLLYLLRNWRGGDRRRDLLPISPIFLFLLCVVIPVRAQDVPTNAPIAVDVPVSDTIAHAAPFDVWEFAALPGEQYRADMQAAEGLAPLLGLRAPSGDIIVASNQFDDGTTQDAEPDDLVTIFFEIPTGGEYALVATRVDTDNGTTQGRYTLTMTLIAAAPVPEDEYVDVTFRCGAVYATTAVALQFEDQSAPESGYWITVYGFDGFDPVIRLGGDDGTGSAACEQSAPPDEPLAFEFNLGDQGSFTFGEVDITSVAALNVPAEQSGPVRITVGSRDGASGHYALRVSGLVIESAGNADPVTVRSGPFAKDEPVTVWMLRDGLNRLDPILAVPDGTRHCVDLGLRSCSDGLTGANLRMLSDGAQQVSPDRLDAVALLEPGDSDPFELAAASQNPRTTGAYTLWLFGVLPTVP